MFYVIYAPDCDLYLNDEGGLGSYEDAKQYSSASDAEWDLGSTEPSLRVVGPCIEGQEP